MASSVDLLVQPVEKLSRIQVSQDVSWKRPGLRELAFTEPGTEVEETLRVGVMIRAGNRDPEAQVKR